MLPVSSCRLLLVGLLGFCASPALCQNRDGSNAQETPGVALVKPQAWSKESSARVLEFDAFTDRRAQGAAASGYIEFRTKSGQNRQIDASRIFKVVVYPDASRLTDVVEPEDRERIVATLNDINEVVKRFPMTRTYLTPAVGEMVEVLKRFDGGEVKLDGEWIQRQVFQEDQAVQIAKILQVDIEQARPPSAFNLEGNPKFQALVTIAKTSPKVKKLADSLTQTHTAKVNAERMEGILQLLSSPSLSLDQARALVSELDTLSPAANSPAKSTLERWKSSDREAVSLANIAAPLSKQLEAEFQTVEEIDPPPSLTTKTRDDVESLKLKLDAFQKMSPPPQISAVATQAAAVAAVAGALEQAGVLFPKKNFLTAKTVLDEASRQAPAVGPESTRVIADLQRFAAAKIQSFSSAREEANMHLGAGRTQEALAKFQEAYEVIPDAAVLQSIEKLQAAPAEQP